MNLKSVACKSISAGAWLMFAMAGATATHAASVVSYTLTNVPSSGTGGWYYDSDTLNDGWIPSTPLDNLLLSTGSGASITFVLDGSYYLKDVSILSDYRDNGIPGNLFSAKVTIGTTSAQVLTTSFGTDCSNFLCNVRLTLPGNLSALVTNTFTLSNFISLGNYPEYTSLGEVTVSAVPEPAAWGLLAAGLGFGYAMRRRLAP